MYSAVKPPVKPVAPKRTTSLGREESATGAAYGKKRSMDRRLANRNLRTAFIAGALALIVFAASFAVGFVY